MKNFYFLVVGLLLSVTAMQAKETANQAEAIENGLTNRYRYAQPIQFVERGVEFFIFHNGEFDFNTHPVVYNRTRRGSINATFGAPRVRTRGTRFNTANIGVRVEHDINGRVRRIGNLFINYDQFGRIKRIGSIYMRYHRGHGLLTQIGGLHLKYNRRGRLIRQFGSIKPFQTDVHIGTNNIPFDDDLQNGHDAPVYDEDLYYYRNNGKQNKFKKGDEDED